MEQGNVFTCVCHSVHWRVCLCIQGGMPLGTGGVYLWSGGVNTPPPGHTPWTHTPGHTPRLPPHCQQAGGTHPTGMLFWIFNIF